MLERFSAAFSRVREHSSKIPPKVFITVGIVTVLLLTGALMSSPFVRNNPFVQKYILRQTVVDEFVIKDASPRSYQSNFTTVGEPTFVFTKPLAVSEEDLPKYFSLEPEVEGTWTLSPDKYVVTFTSGKVQKDSPVRMFPYQSVYEITISKDLMAQGGKKLGEDQSILFRTEKNPDLKVSLRNKFVNTFPDENISLDVSVEGEESSGNSTFLATIYRAEPSQLLSYFTHNDNSEFLYMLSGSPEKVSSYNVKLEQSENGYQSTFNLEPLDPGVYYVTLENTYGILDLFVASTDHITQAYLSEGDIRTWTTTQEGVPLSGAQVTAYSLIDTVQELGKGTSNEEGVSQITASDADIIVSQVGDSYAFTYMPTSWFQEYMSVDIHTETDRPVYKPGDTVHYKAILRTKKNGSYVPYQDPVFMRFSVGYDMEDGDYKEVTPDKDGSITSDFRIPEGQIGQYYSVDLARKVKDEYITFQSQYIEVVSYRKPDLEVQVSTDEVEYISKDKATFEVSGKTLYGSPMKGIRVNYRVLANSYTELKNRSYENISQQAPYYYGEGRLIASGSAELDDQGRGEFSFIADLQDLEDSQLVTVETTPQIAASPSIATAVKLVHRGEFAIFYSDVEADSEAGIRGAVELLDHASPRKVVSEKDVVVELYRVEDDSKTFVSEETVKTSSNGTATFSFDEKNTGIYDVVARAKDSRDNTVVSRYTVQVAQRFGQSSPQTYSYITMSAQKNEIQKGDTSNVISLSSDIPMSSVALLTVTASESPTAYDNTISSLKIIRVNSNSAQIPVELPDSSLPITIQAFTVSDGQVISGSTGITVNTESNHIQTTIRFDTDEAKPGQTVAVTVENRDKNGNPISADNALAIIDSAILQIGKATQDIFEYFWGSPSTPYISSFSSTDAIYTDRGGMGGGCFLTGTQVTTPQGTTAIEDLRIGDTIMTRASDSDATLVPDRVMAVKHYVVDEYYTINGFLHLTPVHRIFANNMWVMAGELRSGDMLVDADGKQVMVESVRSTKGQFDVYNITTEKTHTFIAENIYVHNEKGDDPRQNFADTIYWNPHLQTDRSGKATVDVELPDNITTYSAFATSTSGDESFGQGSAELVSKREVMIIPVLAHHYFADDKPMIGALLQNSTDTDVAGSVLVSIPEISFEREQDISVGGGDLLEISVPLMQGVGSGDKLTVQFDLRDQTGRELDSVSETKAILPRGSINGGWESFTGKARVSFNPEYAETELNMLEVAVATHPASHLFEEVDRYLLNNEYYISPTINTGIDLYISARILGYTDEGKIPASAYHYATLKNNMRRAVDQILIARIAGTGTSIWDANQYYSNEGTYAVDLLVLKGLDEVDSAKLIPDMNNLGNVIANTKKTIGQRAQIISTQDSVIESWVKNKNPQCQDAACVAAGVMSGARSVDDLRSVALVSAEDRYLFTTDMGDFAAFPAVAMIIKGSSSDAEKAIIGLSHQYEYFNEWALLAGVEHAVREKLSWQAPSLEMTQDGNKILSLRDMNGRYARRFTSHTEEDGKITVEVTSEGLPVYGTITRFEYGDSSVNNDGYVDQEKVQRVTRTLPDEVIEKIQTGQMGIVELSIPNRYTSGQSNIIEGTDFIVMDGVSPGYMVLNQTSGNSPQLMSAFQNIYPSSSGPTYEYITDYSEQFVQFEGTSEYFSVVAPYAVWKIADGEFYQPRASVIYPRLGVIFEE